MGRRGVAGQRGTAATSACAHARRALCRLVLAGAFCLVGWAALAVVDADSAAAGERSAGGVKLGGAVSDVVRNTAERGTAGAEARPAPDGAGSAQRAGTRDRGEGNDAERTASPPTRSERGKQHRAASLHHAAGTVDSATEAPGDVAGDGVEQPADRPGGSAEDTVAAVVEQTAAPMATAVDRVSKPLRQARDAFPEPDESLLPGSSLLPDAGAAEEPDHDAGADPSGIEQSSGFPAATGAVPVAGAAELAYVPRSQGQAGSVSGADRQLNSGGGRGHPGDAPRWPTGTGLPPSANTGTSTSTTSGGAGQGAAASYLEHTGMTNEHDPLGIVCTTDCAVLLNDAMKPPVSPD